MSQGASHQLLSSSFFLGVYEVRYADDTTLMAESKELKSLLIKVKEESEKAGFKLNIK